jgi:hypothetical protein
MQRSPCEIERPRALSGSPGGALAPQMEARGLEVSQRRIQPEMKGTVAFLGVKGFVFPYRQWTLSEPDDPASLADPDDPPDDVPPDSLPRQ